MRWLALILVACSSSDDHDPIDPDCIDIETPNGPVPCCGDAGFACVRATRGFEISPVPLAITDRTDKDILLIGYGSYVVNAMASCASCHSSAAGFLAGGAPFPLDRDGHVVYARNLTPDPDTGLRLTDEQFHEALRTGRDVHSDDGMLVVMPWLYYRWASKADLRAIYFYLGAIPPVANPVPTDVKADLDLPTSVPFTGIYDEGDRPWPLPPEDNSLAPNLERGLVIQPLAEPDVLGDIDLFARGSYLANSLSACGCCHTPGSPGAPLGRTATFQLATDHYMTGGSVFHVAPALQPILRQNRISSVNLTGATHGFFREAGLDYEGFAARVTAHVHATDGAQPLGFQMPTKPLVNLLERDLRAIFTYVWHIDPNAINDLPSQDHARWCADATDCDPGETCHVDADPQIGNECVGKPCTGDFDCDTCQTCGATNQCEAPTADSACLANAR